MNKTPVLCIKKLAKTYMMPSKKNGVKVFSNLDLVIETPRIIAIMGESGSGKTTLLNLIGMLDKPTKGEIFYNGIERSNIKNPALFRRKNIGFVFQNHLLQDEFSALENIALPLLLLNMPFKKAFSQAEKILDEVGLSHRKNHKPSEMSGGENQRIAIARALVHNPSYILADEPTGNLDYENQSKVNKLFIELNLKFCKTVIIATHSVELANLCQEIWILKKGRLLKKR